VRASVVIPTRDKASRLRLTLACLAGQAWVPAPEVVVVDDGSTDATPAVLAAAAADLPGLVVVPGGGGGRAVARNLGAGRAGGELLVFLDDDVLVGPGFLAAHRARARPDRFTHGRLRELPAAERLVAGLAGAAAGGARELRDALHAGGSRDPRHRLVANALERAVEAMSAGVLPDVAPWLGCVGANVSMPRAAWAALGGFDERFGRRWGCEDLELGLRLHAAGLCRQFAPDALGVHLTHPRPGRWAEHARSLDQLAALHPLAGVRALDALLSAAGDPHRYVEQVLAGQPSRP
jgi:glycosyltransferase involved in cell wall biosynthesis